MTAHRYAPPKAPIADVDEPGRPRPWRGFDSPATLSLRRMAALTLAASLFMPLTRCSSSDSSGATALVDLPWYGAVLVLAAFAWPLLFEALGRLADRLPLERPVPLLRLGLCAGSLSALAWLTCLYWLGWATLRYGAFVAMSALAGYVLSMLILLRRRRRSGRGA